MTPQGKYSYKSNGDPKAISKTDVLYYKTSTGKENQIVIRYNISQNNVHIVVDDKPTLLENEYGVLAVYGNGSYTFTFNSPLKLRYF